MDEQLLAAIADVCRYPDPSPQRQKALNRLLLLVQQLPGIYKSSHPDYLEALNLTWEWFSRNIDSFEHRPPSVQQSLVTWINGYLKWRIRDLYGQVPDTLSLDRPLSRDDEQTTWLDRVSDNPFNPTPLSLLDHKIEQLQDNQRQSIALRLRHYIEQDPGGKLAHCHPRKSSQCHCQLLAIRMLLQEPPSRIADLTREFNVNNQTLYWHWKNKCLPLLQEIARNFGYQP